MKTFKLHLLKKKNKSHFSIFISFIISPTPSCSPSTPQNSTNYLNNDPKFSKSPLANSCVHLNPGVLTWKTVGTVPQGEFCWQTQRVTGPCRRESLGGLPAGPRGAVQGFASVVFVALQEIWPRQPVALQIIFPGLLRGFWFAATRCSVNCHTEASEQLSISSCRTRLTQAEHCKAELPPNTTGHAGFLE